MSDHILRPWAAHPMQPWMDSAAQESQTPVGWFESPHGAFRANPLYKIEVPSSLVAWQIPVYIQPPAAPAEPAALSDEDIERVIAVWWRDDLKMKYAELCRLAIAADRKLRGQT